MTTHTKRRLVRSLLALAGAIALFVGVVGFAHTPKGRFLLAYIPGMGACPVGTPATAEQIEKARDVGRAAVRGTQVAKARPALGFELERTTKTEILAWAAKHGVACDDQPKKLQLVCRDVPAHALVGARHDAESLFFWVDREEHLVSLEAMRRTMSWDDAVKLVEDRGTLVAAEAGGASTPKGVRSGDELKAAGLGAAEVELRYTNYRFVVSARNQGGTSPVVRERYQAIDDTKM